MTMAWPLIVTACADCGIGTIRIGEWYMVHDAVWEEAWNGRRKSWHGKVPGQEILCIGCLEIRLGRTLTAFDFTDAQVNDVGKGNISPRMRARLMATDPTPPQQRKRGRPKGSKNKPKAVARSTDATEQPTPKRKRGRPKGSKNRPPATPPATPPA